jgi:poly(hydroxyalkanoate) depolymerase family esterase
LNTFLKKILAATGMTRHGRLDEATKVIQQALARRAAATASPAAGPAAKRAPGTVDVFDGLVREVAVAEAEAPPVVARTEHGEETHPSAPPATAPARPATGRFAASSFTGASGTRSFKLFEPAGFEGKALPLIVMLHGCTQSSDDFAAGTRMNALAQERGLFVLYPEQAPRSNANKCWNWFVPGDQRRGHGEPALLAGMTRHVMATHAVDGDRVYVAGLSAGGAMAAILAREYPDLYAAAGVHSGLPAGAAHDVASAFAAMQSGPSSSRTGLAASPLRTPLAAWPSVAPLEIAADVAAGSAAEAAHGAPLIVFHGDADATVNALNGAHVVDAALGTATWQATRDVATSAANGGRSFTRVVYHGDEGSAVSRAEHWVVHGTAHAWSGGDASGSFTDGAGPDASREMLRFFAEHPLRHEVANAAGS